MRHRDDAIGADDLTLVLDRAPALTHFVRLGTPTGMGGLATAVCGAPAYPERQSPAPTCADCQVWLEEWENLAF